MQSKEPNKPKVVVQLKVWRGRHSLVHGPDDIRAGRTKTAERRSVASRNREEMSVFWKFSHFPTYHLWYLQLRKPLKMSLREPMWCRLSRMTTVGSSVSVSSELHCSARLDKY